MSPTRVRHPDLRPTTFHGMVTVAPEMMRLFELVKRAGRADATVLIRGESGTGKELVATALHHESPRSHRPFHAVNCATFTSELLASELFGHVRGAFTGAVRDRQGLLSLADTGTLFLDEVAEMPLELQARLLRVLQQQRFTPVGGTVEQSVDVRVFSATNAALRRLVAERRFREDLMYRLRVVTLYLPRLAERTGDIEALTWHYIDRFNARGARQVHAISTPAWEAMHAYPWPGNIRELRNNLEQCFVLGEGPTIELEELAPELRGEWVEEEHLYRPAGARGALGGPAATRPAAASTVPAAPAAAPPTLEDLQRQELIDAFHATGGHRIKMAEHLGISRPTLYRRLKKYGLT